VTREPAAPPLVLMYHSVQPYAEDPYRVTVHPYRFERQMSWLHRHGLRGTGMADLLRAQRTGRARSLVGLSFDDGYADFATQVLPILARYGFGATVFVVAGRLGGENGWDRPGPRKSLMSAEQVRRVAAAGIEIGSHGLTHPRLPGVGAEELRGEVGDSRAVLTALTGQEVAGFCYPYGAAGAREVAAVRGAGYGYGCVAHVRDQSPSTLDIRYTLPRTHVGDGDTAPRLFAKRLRHRLIHGRPAPGERGATGRAGRGGH
jgi:peptidoglycan/xylan/chitin deacetylase (PgdA/CDA1 family)